MLGYTFLDVTSTVQPSELQEVGDQDEIVDLIMGLDAVALLLNLLLDSLHQPTETMLHKIDGEDAQLILQGPFLFMIILQVQPLDKYRSMFQRNRFQDRFMTLVRVHITDRCGERPGGYLTRSIEPPFLEVQTSEPGMPCW